MTKAEVHSLDLVDRNALGDGQRHRHRWAASCVCGKWASIPLRSKQSVIEGYRSHVQAAEAEERRAAKRAAPTTRRKRRALGHEPRPVTPRHLLPDELR